MNVSVRNRTICKYYLRGMCRYGKRCWNIHENPEKLMEILLGAKSSCPESQTDSQLGACALSPSKSRVSPKKNTVDNKIDISGPSTSSITSVFTVKEDEKKEEKTCGICFDVILKKATPLEQTFGLLPNCNHCFCFTCIKKWRQSKEFDFEVSKSCPECRVASDFVYPTKIWLENQEKDNYIYNQKQRMKKLDCKYFQKGRRPCPFGNTCLYRHALPDGKVLDVGPPRPRRKQQGSSDEFVHQILFWLNDSALDLDSDSDIDSDLDLDLSDPCIAYQYYDRDDIRRYLALEQLLNCDDDESNMFLMSSFD